MPDLNAIASQLADFERITREYVEEDPVQNANTSIETATDQFNAWIEETTPGLEREKAALADLLKTINELSDEIDDVGRRLKVSPQDGSCPGTGECDEAALTRYNGLVQRYNALVKDYKQKEGGYSVRVREFNGEAERRRAQVQSVKATVTSDFEAYQRWVREEGLERLWKELIAVHVTLMQRARLRRPSDELQGFIQRVRHLRRVLGAHAMQQRDTVEGGPHVVRATLCQSEECHLLVDCGASVIAITPELVDVLGLHDRLGEKVKIILPNAIRIEAPQLVIPKIRIGEAEADYVKAVVLKEPLPGVDGCLGLSFLDRFNYRIENRSLSLEPLEPAESEPCFV
jgi:aspartyl protease family protein